MGNNNKFMNKNKNINNNYNKNQNNNRKPNNNKSNNNYNKRKNEIIINNNPSNYHAINLKNFQIGMMRSLLTNLALEKI